MGAYGGPFANQDDPGGLFLFDHETSTVDESEETFTVTVKLMAAFSETVTVDYLTVDGTATALEDYTAVSGTLTFASGAISQTVAVPITDDSLPESSETIQLWLHQAVGAPLGPRINTTLTIQDNDHVTPSITLSANENTLQEYATKPAVVQVRRDAGTEPLTITYTVDGSATAGVDYNKLSGTVVIPSEATYATIEVIPINDRDSEDNETLIITLEDGDEYNPGAGDSVELTIADNDRERTAIAGPHTGDTMTVSASEVGINIAPGSAQQETEVVYTDLGPESPANSKKGSIHAGHWFTLGMEQQGSAVSGTVLDPPLRVTLWYDDTGMGEADEEDLMLYQWDEASTTWQPAGSITLLDTESNVLMVLLDGPGEYGLFYQTQPAQVTVQANQSSVMVGDSLAIEVTVTSAQEKPLSGQTVSLGTTLGSLDPLTAETDENGVATSILHAGTAIGEAMVTATIGDLTDSISVTIVAGEPEVLAMDARQTSVVVGSTASITLTVMDGYNHLLASTPITLSTKFGSLAPASATTDANGQALVTFEAGPTVGEALVTAYTGGITESLSFSVVAGDLDEMTVEAAETEIAVGASTIISATLTDAYDNPITNQPVGFHSTLGSLAPASATTDDNGQAVVTFDAGPTAGEAIITVQSVTLSRQVTIAITAEVNPSPTDELQITVDEQQGGTLRVEDQETGKLLLEADIPAGAVQQSTTIKYSQMSESPITLPGTDVVFAGHWFKLEAYQNETLVSPMQFAKPISLTVMYQDPSLSASEEQSVKLYHLDHENNTWTATGVVQQRDTVQNRIIVSLDHLTTFGVFYQADEEDEEVVYLPLLQK